MGELLRLLFFALIVRPLVWVVIGLHVRYRERLPPTGPALLAANHNSHLDTLVLLSLFPLRLLPRLRPVAAVDYFLTGGLLSWFALTLIKIIPLRRHPQGVHEDPLAGVSRALEAGDIVVLFPEGGRGEPERLDRFKTGIAHLAKRHPEVPVTPVFLHGLGKALPRGEGLLVPFFCDVFVGESFRWKGDKPAFMAELESRMTVLAQEGRFSPWE